MAVDIDLNEDEEAAQDGQENVEHFKTDAALQNLVRYYASQANDYADLKSDDFFKIVYHGAYKYHFKSLSMHGRDKYSHFARIRFFIGEITNAEYDNLKTSDLDHHPGKPAGVSNALFNAVLVDASLSAMIKATAEQRAKWKAAAKAKNKSKKNMLRNKRKQPDFTNDGIDTAGTSTTRAGTSAETMQNNRAKKTAVIPRRTTNEPRQESAQPPGGLLPEVGERFLVSLPNFQFGPKIGKMTFNRFMTNEAFWKFVDSDEDYNLIRDAIDEADKEAREAKRVADEAAAKLAEAQQKELKRKQQLEYLRAWVKCGDEGADIPFEVPPPPAPVAPLTASEIVVTGTGNIEVTKSANNSAWVLRIFQGVNETDEKVS